MSPDRLDQPPAQLPNGSRESNMTDRTVTAQTSNDDFYNAEDDDKKSVDTGRDFERLEHPQSGVRIPGEIPIGDVEKQNHQQQPGQLKAEQKDPNLVEWDGPDDPGNPMNWPRSKKWLNTMMLASVTFAVTFASSVFSAASGPTSNKFGVSPLVMVLGTSLFVLVRVVFAPLWKCPC